MKAETSAVILARVSSKAQEDEGYSLDSQLKLLLNYCEQQTLHVDKIFKIAETASKDQSRKVFKELMTYLRTNKANHLLVEKTDRLTRNFRDAVVIDEWLDKNPKRKVHAVKENLVLHKEAKSDVKFMWNIHLSVAKKYTDNLREEAMKGWAEKLAQGWMPSRPPIGYITSVVHGKRIHIPDPETKHLIKHLFEYYLQEGQSANTCVDEMARLGLTSFQGGHYHKSQVARMLANPFYVGVIEFNNNTYKGSQEPIIPQLLFDRVQEKLGRKSGPRRTKHEVSLKGLITCTSCNGFVTWQLQKGHYYGSCQRRSEGCKQNKYLRLESAEEQLVKSLDELVSPVPEVVDWVRQELKRRVGEIQLSTERSVQVMNDQISRINRMQEALYEDKLEGEITKEFYQRKKEQYDHEKTVYLKQLEAQKQAPEVRIDEGILLLKLTQSASELFSSRSSAQKRLLLSKLFASITYSGTTLKVKRTRFCEAISKNVQASKLIQNNR